MSRYGDDERTRQNVALPSPDEQATRAHADVGVVAELRAAYGTGDKKTLPLYALPDQIVVGRGTAADWQLDDPSLSRKHCQFRWNGRELTVEDLGSANGTRVGGRPARTPLPVTAADVVQLGTVMISFVPLVHEPAGRNPDAEATRLVHAPVLAGVDSGEPTPVGPAAAPLPGVATVVRAPSAAELAPLSTVVKAPGQHGPPNARAAVFHPERDAAGPDEETREWDPNAALQHPPERALDAAELVARVKAAWRTNRRPFVLGGAAVWIAILIGLVSWKQSRTAADDDVVPPPPPRAPLKPVVTQLPRATGVGAAASGAAAGPSGSTATPSPAGGDTVAATGGDNIVEPSSDREQDLADAIAAYDNGRPQEALKYFRRLATDPNDQAARFMVQLIESRPATPDKAVTP